MARCLLHFDEFSITIRCSSNAFVRSLSDDDHIVHMWNSRHICMTSIQNGSLANPILIRA